MKVGRRLPSATLLGVLLVLAAAFGIRAVYLVGHTHPVQGAGLAAEQGEIARNLVDRGRWFVVNPRAYDEIKSAQTRRGRLIDPAHFDFSRADARSSPQPEVDQMPGLGLVEALVWSVTGQQVYAPIQWLQVVLDTLMALLVYWIARRLGLATPFALLASAFYAAWPGAIVMTTRPLLDTWAAFFTIGSVATFVWARQRPASRRRIVLLGLVAGLGLYVRPFVLLVPLALGLVAAPGGGWRRRLMWSAAPTALALLVLAPWTARNYVEFHRFIPTRVGLGQALFEGVGSAPSDEEAAKYVKKRRPGATYGSPSYDQSLLHGALQAVQHDPAGYLRIIGRRARLLLPCLLLLAVMRVRRREALIPVTAAAATIIPYVPIGDDTRFYLPAAFGYIILSAMVAESLVTGVTLARARRGTRAPGEARGRLRS